MNYEILDETDLLPYNSVDMTIDSNNNISVIVLNDNSDSGVQTNYFKMNNNEQYDIMIKYNCNNNYISLLCIDDKENIILNEFLNNNKTCHTYTVVSHVNCMCAIYIILNSTYAKDSFVINKFIVLHHSDKIQYDKDTNNSDEDIVQNMDLKEQKNYNKFKKLNILVTSTQYPGYGGAATNAYCLIQYMKNIGIKTAGIFIDNNIHKKKICVDPDNIGNIYSCRLHKVDEYIKDGCLSDSYTKECSQIRKSIIKFFDNNNPDIIFSFNYFAPIVSKYLFPSAHIIYAVTGSPYLTKYPDMINDYFKIKQSTSIEPYTCQLENICNYICDSIAPNTNIMKNVFLKNYPESLYKCIDIPIDLTKIIAYKSNSITYSDRIYDVGIISSRFDRKIKNSTLAQKIYQHKNLDGLKKLAIGMYSNEYFKNINNTKCVSLCDHKDVISYLQQLKILIIPSFFESASIVLREALMNGCIILTNNNVGLSDRISELFVCNSVDDESEWIYKINTFLKNYDIIKTYDILEYDQSTEQIFSIVYNDYIKCKKRDKNKINILVASVDTPYIGGSGSNAYRTIKSLRKDPTMNVIGLFLDNTNNNLDPDKIGGLLRLKFNKANMIEYNFDRIRKMIYNRYNICKIDLIYAKNYKTVIVCKKLFPSAKVIFSPSGSRFYSIYSAENGYKTYGDLMDDIDDDCIDYNYTRYDDIHKYLEEDIHIETVSMEKCDTILTNSFITYNLLKKLYSKFSHKLYHPISLSNIYTPNNIEHEIKNIDIIFCAYNWKRKVKNPQMVRNIINHSQMKNYNIEVIGQCPDIISNKILYPNVKFLGECDQKTVMEKLQKSKVYVVTSFYDSNPNTVIEALSCKCKIVMSTNVGQYENFTDNYIIHDYYNINEWVSKIIYALGDNEQVYLGQTSLEALVDLKQCIRDTLNKQQITNTIFNKNGKAAVFFYKLPAIWDTYSDNIFNKDCDFKYKEDYSNISEVSKIINYDLFYKMFRIISNNMNCTEFHYIGISPDDEMHYYNASKIIPNLFDVHIWLISKPESIQMFYGAQYYYTRGAYNNVYNNIILNNPTAITLNYRATSIPMYKDVLKSNARYNIVLYDDNRKNIKKMHPTEILIKFYKFAHDNFFFKNMERIYDICFVATHSQTTKNHKLFTEFIKYCEASKYKISAVYIGDYTKLQCFQEIVSMNLKYVKLYLFKYLSGIELNDIYNQSKTNILFSGRDCFPRVITESINCGCFNIAFDTLTDGKWVYDGILGELIGSNDIKQIKTKSRSTMYPPSKILFNRIIDLLNINYDHKVISEIGRERFSLKKNVDNIINCIRNIENIKLIDLDKE